MQPQARSRKLKLAPPLLHTYMI